MHSISLVLTRAPMGGAFSFHEQSVKQGDGSKTAGHTPNHANARALLQSICEY
jgi:hypothetical protein